MPVAAWVSPFFPDPTGLSRRGPGLPAHWSEARSETSVASLSPHPSGPVPTPLLTRPHLCWALALLLGVPRASVSQTSIRPPFPTSFPLGLSCCSCPHGYLAAQDPLPPGSPLSVPIPHRAILGSGCLGAGRSPVSLLASPPLLVHECKKEREERGCEHSDLG